MSFNVWRTGRTIDQLEENDEDSMQEVVDQIDKRFGYGSSAPDSNTAAKIYFQTGVGVWIKIDNTFTKVASL